VSEVPSGDVPTPGQTGSPSNPNVNSFTSYLPTGIGVQGGGAVEGGFIAGAGANAVLGVGAFYNSDEGLNASLFASGGAFAGGPGASVSAPSGENVGTGDFAIGGYAGVGTSVIVTNAGSVQDLAGPFSTWTINIGFGPVGASVQFEWGQNAQNQDIWVLGYGGPPLPLPSFGYGVSISGYQTYTQPLPLQATTPAQEPIPPYLDRSIPIGGGLYYQPDPFE
jgi:hypothetical protein